MSRLPNTFLIGAAKCGTTALATYLADRDDVFLGFPKEPSYWSSDYRQGGATALVADRPSYEQIYAAAQHETIVLDASTSYLYSEVAVPRIVDEIPDARFIVLLRNPVDMAYAYHMEKVFNCFEDERSFEAAWRLQQQRRRGERIPPRCPEPKELQYAEIAALGTQLARARSLTAPENLLILWHEEMVRDTGAVYRQCLEFLGLPADARVDFPRHGAAHQNRFPALARIYQSPSAPLAPAVRLLKRTLASNRNGRIRRVLKSALSRKTPRSPLSESFRRELSQFFEPEIALLETTTGRDLAHWKRAPQADAAVQGGRPDAART